MNALFNALYFRNERADQLWFVDWITSVCACTSDYECTFHSYELHSYRQLILKPVLYSYSYSCQWMLPQNKPTGVGPRVPLLAAIGYNHCHN